MPGFQSGPFPVLGSRTGQTGFEWHSLGGITLLLVVEIGLGGTVASAASMPVTATPTAAPEVPDVPVWLRGSWTRDWIKQGRLKTNPDDVHYLQTPSYFVDMRIPRNRPSLAHARSFADLTDAQLRLLGHQNGFTGLTAVSGSVATWNHDIQFQPSDGSPDSGRLQRLSARRMEEHGLDESYIESWRAGADGMSRFLVIRVEHDGRLLKTLVVVGNQFIYVRNRSLGLPAAASFDALFDAVKPSREQMKQYLDCEFSMGRIRGGSMPWEIERSTLPWREGRHVELVDEFTITHSRIRPNRKDDNEWSMPVNTFSPTEIKGILSRE
jgi:hypothetical protein